jgi:L-rhamnose isomerase/sugar isomerase
MASKTMEAAYGVLVDQLTERGIDAEKVKVRLKSQRIETPSWGYGNSGTRFKVFQEPGAARDLHERLEDAACVHRLTGVCPSVAIHIPWDKVPDFGALTKEAATLGIRIGAVNPNVFQDYDYKMGSFGNVRPEVRKRALEHMFECIEIMKQVGSTILSLWFADGTNYPGQGDFRRRKRWFEEGLGRVYERLPEQGRMLIEYKFFEPGFYHTDIPDWGTAYLLCCKLGPKADVLIDLGHHPLSTNVEQIVATLLDEGRLGGFHFNNRKYADDDLTIGSIDPYEIFRIFNELVPAENDPGTRADIAYMIDQSHIIKRKMEAMIQSVMNIQTAYAKALLVDHGALEAAQMAHDTVECERILQAAYQTDVNPILAKVREEMGIAPDPIDAYRKSGYQEEITKARQGTLKGAASWGA